MKSKFSLFLGTVIAILAMFVASCSIPGANSSVNGVSAKSGTLVINVTDAPPDKGITEINVTVSSVEVHLVGDNTDVSLSQQETEQENGKNKNKNNNQNQSQQNDNNDAGWVVIPMVKIDNTDLITQNPDGSRTFNLLDLQGVEAALAGMTLPAGTYTQLRMEVTNVNIKFEDNTNADAKVPSGKIKFVHPFDIIAGSDTVLLFDFDANSVKATGNGQYIFQPVIKLTTTKTPVQFKITTPKLPDGKNGTVYDNTDLAAVGGTEPYTWSVDSGALPTGLMLTAAGRLYGTPGSSGDFTFTIKVVDSSSTVKSATREYTVEITNTGT
jgi:hypothetical protein